MSRFVMGLAALPLSLLAACGTSQPTTDELAGESTADDTVDAKSDSPYADAYTYFAIKQDLRKCVSPLCGGYFVERLNRAATQCADGSYASSCYVADLDWGQTALPSTIQQKLVDSAAVGSTSDGVRAIVRGRVAAKSFASYGNLGTFVVSEAWVAAGSVPSDGVFVKMKDNGVRCITAPCPSTTEYALNRTASANISDVDWSESGLTDRAIAGLSEQMFTGGLIVAGWREYTTVNGHTAKARSVTTAYQRLVPDAPTPEN